MYGSVVAAASYCVGISGIGAGGWVCFQTSLLARFDYGFVLSRVVDVPDAEGAVLGAGEEFVTRVGMPATAV